MPRLSRNWSVPFSPRSAWCCAMDSSTAPAPITSSNYPRNLGSTSTELPNERWRFSASQRALSSLPTECATAIGLPSSRVEELSCSDVLGTPRGARDAPDRRKHLVGQRGAVLVRTRELVARCREIWPRDHSPLGRQHSGTSRGRQIKNVRS